MSTSHIHTYKRVRRSKTRFMCIDPDCTHVNTKELILGKRAKCMYCGEEFILTRYALGLAVPKCENCRNSRNGDERQVQEIEDILKNLG
jgi:hypothetical protein